MKSQSRFIHKLSTLLFVFIIIALPVSLSMKDIGGVLFTHDSFRNVIDQAVFDYEMIGKMARTKALAIGLDQQKASENEDAVEAPILLINSLNTKEWQEILGYILPKESFGPIVDSFSATLFAWLNSEDPYPQIKIRLTPTVQNIKENLSPIIDIVFKKVPICLAEKAQEILAESIPSISQDLPNCIPRDREYRHQLKNSMIFEINQLLSEAPSEINLDKDLQSKSDLLQKTRQQISGISLKMKLAWLPVLLIFLLAILLSARSKAEIIFKAGGPLVLSGSVTIIVSILFLSLSNGVPFWMMEPIIPRLPEPAVVYLVQALATHISAEIWQKLLIQAIIITLVGAGLMLGHIRCLKTKENLIKKQVS